MKLIRAGVVSAMTLLALQASYAQSSGGPAVNEFDCTIDNFVTRGYCVAPGGAVSRTDTRLYTGLVWELGSKQIGLPQIVFGLTSVRVRSSDRLEGADFGIRVSYADKIAIDSLRLSYVFGNRVVRGNVGGGYSVAHTGLLVTGGVQTAYLRAGADYLVSGKELLPYVELNTLSRPRKVVGGGCSSGSLMTWDFSNSDYDYNTMYTVDQIFTNGQTCYTELGSNIGP